MDSERRQLQGPKPAALMVSKNSTKINKHQYSRSPVVVYLRSPKVIHVRPEEFMGLVQHLTGKKIPVSAAGANSDSTASLSGSYVKPIKGSLIRENLW